MFQRILVVCTGNVCRSPVAEAMLRRALPGKQVASAGLGALVGQNVDLSARELAEAEGLDVSIHQARQLTTEMLINHDLILVMSSGQRRAVGELAPEALGKTMLLGKWLAAGKGLDIPDPYRKSREAFEHVHQLLAEATAGWVARL
ncbi:low molecular weight phosphotyrosine protein phosphatase [Halomonas sp. KAO]|uniref:low molecular weight protein-tyrosine-phosphatase n=1 Tax=unclassified Halomonas TaxID=2609666 RepID=UPI00189ECD3D|nr:MULTISPECIES: low molecular weight protein-tyrosine-phosphatase [unclassified Halomonas]MBF7053196.1 low molecular weight phosphotyrosine protein phosphatase [Halomonas sp. KAO]MDT0499415.1 low molecular weight protein-tyrosine-phosphatase [Halomonas sp. PAR7]MDT0510768.1 low molecular weight protein-tyrosine-phosphatase [Halomonas sp. LES1]MDT0591703.1 low molecular weight protein-tyrosine-phosphatase [Halomonas sp. PAR8]